MAGMKKCWKCGETKPLSEFYKDRTRSDGLQHRCKLCNHASRQEYIKANPEKEQQYKLRQNYNISLERFREMLAEQDGCCAICQTHDDDLTRSIHVDHDRGCCAGSQSCGDCVRGLLCHNCNTAIGLLQESEDVIGNALRYIQERKISE